MMEWIRTCGILGWFHLSRVTFVSYLSIVTMRPWRVMDDLFF